MRLTICDDDAVYMIILQTQIVNFTDAIGEPKVESARRTLSRINPNVQVTTIAERVNGERLDGLVASANVVIDCTDNFSTRHAINRACVKFRKPLVSGAAIRFDGQ